MGQRKVYNASIMESFYRNCCLSIEQLDVIEVLENKRRKQILKRDKFLGMRRISPVQFLRDRELGMHGTNASSNKESLTSRKISLFVIGLMTQNKGCINRC